jgi:hypothetical protein
VPDGRKDLRLATPAIVAACLAFAVGIFATVVRLDRDRAFYPTVAIVIAGLYSLFAVMGGSTRALVLESLVGVGFVALAVLGFRTSLWVVAAALGLHGVFDLVHGAVISNPGVPLEVTRFRGHPGRGEYGCHGATES